MTEEDLRTKIVTEWLRDHGFSSNEIALEFSFTLQVGRQTFRIGPPEVEVSGPLRPRTDVLVRFVDGRNFAVIEVKAPNEALRCADSRQAISYARLLQDGGLAPFAVITNGYETHIYDALSGERLDGASIPLDHPRAIAGFRVSAFDLSLRTEAAALFLSLSPNNLSAFCDAQVHERIAPLRGMHWNTGKKYIPDLYVSRPVIEDSVGRLLESGRRVVLLLGPPQVGKTNLMCHLAEKRLRSGRPTLFYPAFSMGGLLEEIAADFSWILRQDANSVPVVVERLGRLARVTDDHFVIFIDGWNEATIQVAHLIDREAARVASTDIRLVVSLTSLASQRLFFDQLGNPGRLAEAAEVTPKDAKIIESGVPPRRRDDSCIVWVGALEKHESAKLYQVASQAFDASVQAQHQEVLDPMLVRMAMEVYAGRQLPFKFDERELLNHQVEAKLARTRLDHKDEGRSILRYVATAVEAADGPASWEVAVRQVSGATSSTLDALCEAALLARRGWGPEGVLVDFYFSRERDYVVAEWSHDWTSTLSSPHATLAIESAARTEVGREALEWFVSQEYNESLLIGCLGHLASLSLGARRVITAGASRKTEVLPDNREQLIQRVRLNADDADPIVKANLARVIALVTEDAYEVAQLIEADPQLLASLLAFDYYDDDGAVEIVILDALRTHSGHDEESPLVNVVRDLITHGHPKVRKAAASAFGYMAPLSFLSWMGKATTTEQSLLEAGLSRALATIDHEFYGEMCPGVLDLHRNDPEYREVLVAQYRPPLEAGLSRVLGTKWESRIVRMIEALDPDSPLVAPCVDPAQLLLGLAEDTRPD